MFKVDKMFKLPEAGNLLAFADVSVCDKIIIRGFRILKGKKGIFISCPQEHGKDNRWYDQVVFKDAETFEEISNVLMKHYKKEA